MRSLSALLCAVLLGCTPSAPSPTQTALSQPVPGPPLTLDATLLHPGAQATFTVTGVPANRPFWIVASPAGAGAGPCYPLLRGACLGIREPIVVLGSAFANGASVGTISAVVPPTLEGRTLTFQATTLVTAPATLSNTIVRTIGRDLDGDGVEFDQGDCDDGDAAIGPQSFDLPGNGVDDDCDGGIDNASAPCDSGLSLADDGAFPAAAALGLCGASSSGHGLLAATYVLPTGAAAPGVPAFHDGHGLVQGFGAIAPQQGDALLALSTGTARAPGQPSYQPPAPGSSKGYLHGLPAGFSLTRPGCPEVLSSNASDGIGLQLQVRVPENASGFTFRHRALFTDHPNTVCSSFNDAYGVMMDPAPPALGTGERNVVLAANGGPITVASSDLVRTCAGCPDGTSDLAGTGFEDHGATAWLQTDVPAEPGSVVTLRFVVWDSGDSVQDSTALFDGFAWLSGQVDLQTTLVEDTLSPDDDGDGTTVAQGDCDDDDDAVGPHAFDVPGNGVDDDCDGVADNDGLPCDATLLVDDGDARSAAAAMGLCRTASPGTQGVLAASYVLPNGSPAPGAASFPLGHGLSPGFGAMAPQEGLKVLALSSGAARTADQPGFIGPIPGLTKGYAHPLPANFDPDRDGCGVPLSGNANDGIGLQVTLRVPSNATGFAFSHRALFADYPALVCTSFNDGYTVSMDPAPPGLGSGERPLLDDGFGDPISVTTAAWLTTCNGCPDGGAELVGTGFDANAATAWLRTQVPVTPGDTVTLRFSVWDGGDGAFDTTALFDAFTWLDGPVTLGTSLQVGPLSPDDDLDGVPVNKGDCDDTDELVGPQALDLPGNGVDDDCDGTIDNDRSVCDAGLALDDPRASRAAAALGLCVEAAFDPAYGVVDAAYTLPNGGTAPAGPGFPLGHGLLPSFGVNLPEQGASVLALSSGTARSPSQSGFQAPDTPGFSKGYANTVPNGFGRSRSDCVADLSSNAFDGVALQVQVRVPVNVTGFAFHHRAFFSDFPNFSCTAFNDAYGVLMDPAPPPVGPRVSNIVLDGAGGPITQTSAFVTTCAGCTDGSGDLTGTGFSGFGATGWLRTEVPATPGEVVTLRFVVWDSGDAALDSTALFDGFEWLTGGVALQTTAL